MLIARSSTERENDLASLRRPALPTRDTLAKQHHISFYGERVSDRYTALLIDVLKNRRSAVTLTLCGCEISHEALERLVEALPDMHHLTGLEIVRPECKPGWLLALEQGLPGNTSLTCLEIVVSKTTVEHAKRLAQGLRLNRSLERVQIFLDCRKQVLLLLKYLLASPPSKNALDPTHYAKSELPIPRLRQLLLYARKEEFAHQGGKSYGEACRLLTQLIDERTLLERVDFLGVLGTRTWNETIANLGRTADRQMVNLRDSLSANPSVSPALNISELRRRQYLFASPAALRAAASALEFKPTQDGFPLPEDLMRVIASHLPSSGPQRAAWILRGLLSVTKEARQAADSARSSAHARRLLRHLQCEPGTAAKGISDRKKKASAEALADIWRLGLAGFPLQPHDQKLVTKATKKNPVWQQCRSLVEEKVMRLSKQHHETERMLEKHDSPQLARVEELGRTLNGPGLPIIAMRGLL